MLSALSATVNENVASGAVCAAHNAAHVFLIVFTGRPIRNRVVR
jgi:hypothetical protein